MRNLSYSSLFLGALFLLSGTTLSAQQVPSIDSQNVIPSVDEDNNVTINIADLVITDDDPPEDFTLNIKEETGYSIINNTTVLPDANLNGQISVTITVSDLDDGESDEFNYLVDITPVNDIPVIDGQVNNSVVIDEETSLTIETSDLIINDPDDGDTHSVVIDPGDNYTSTGNEFTPNLNYYGPLEVKLHVNDGTEDSESYTYLLSVTNVNDLPVVTGQVNASVGIQEESTLIIAVEDLVIEDPDAGDTHTVVIEAGSNYTFSGNTATPDEDYFGDLLVNLRVSDGTGLSDQFAYQLTVTNVNDAPTLDLIGNVLLEENGPSGDAQLSGISTGAANEVQTLVVSIESNSNPALFDGAPVIAYSSPDETGAITFTPAADMFGDAIITVRVSEVGEIEFAEQTFTVSVTEVSDPLLITDQDDVSVNEDADFIILTDHLTIQGTDEPSALTINVLSDGLNYTSSGATITPSPNYSGTLSIPITVSDGLNTSPSFNFMLDVNPVNDAPTIASISNVSMDEDAAQIDIPLSGIAAGPLESQDLTVTASTADEWLFQTFAVIYSSPSSDGILRVRPATNAFGTAQVTITVTDNGPTGSPHVNTTSTSFTINVDPENDPPLITGQDAVSVDEDNTFTILVDHLTIIDHDDDTEFTLTVDGDGTNYTASGNTITPSPNYFGSLTIPITVTDGSPPGTSYDFILPVNAINDAPTIAGPATIDIDENAPETGFPLTGISAGPFETQGLTLFASSDNTALFAVAVEYSSPSSTGTLNVTPALNASGTANARVTVTDNGPGGVPHINTAFVDITINVNDVIIPPVITGQNTTPSTNEETQITLDISHLDVTDPDNTFPTGFTLNVKPGPDYTIGTGTNITPNANVSGTISVLVSVTDPDGFESNDWNFEVDVTPVNDPPVISGQVNNSRQMNEDASLTLVLADIIFSDPDPSDTHTLIVQDGTNYTRSGNQITPTANYFGPLSVNVVVYDGTVNSNVYAYSLEVINVNDAPTLDAIGAVSMDEDSGPLDVPLAGITPGPGETEAVTITAESSNTTLLPDPAVTYSGGTNGSLSLQPVADRSGTATVTVTASDGTATVVRSFTVTVDEVNDLPTINPIGDISVPENSPPQVVNFNGITDGSPNEVQITNVSVTNNNGALFASVAPAYVPGAGAGTIAITPNLNVSGSATFTVTVSDGVDEITEQFVFTITSVNDPPSFAAIDDVTVDEDAGLQTVDITGVSPGPGETQDLTFFATSSNTTLIPTPTVDYTQGATTATLNFQSAANRSGASTITVTVEDADGLQFTDNFVINVTPINDAPTISTVANTDIAEDAAQTGIILSGITAGPQESQVLTVTATTGNLPLFEVFEVVYTSPSATGTLNVKPKPNLSGTAQVTITVTDNGSGVAPNVNTTTTNFTINVTPANDPPVITGQVASSVNEDNNFTIVVGHLTIADPDNSSGFTITVAGGPNYTFSGTTITPALNYYGPLTIPITVSDGTSSSATFNFALTVNGVNDPPVITGHDPIAIDEAEPFQLLVSHLTIMDPDTEDVYPDDFTLTILSGSDYSVTGTTITPIANFNGTLQVPVFVKDPAGANSNTFTVNIEVNSVNDPPVITGQAVAINSSEDQSVVLNLSQLTVVDPDNVPADLTLVVQPGPNYTFSGLTVTPAANFNGPLNVSVVVNDGELNSAVFSMLVTVNAANDAPVITGQNPVTTTEDVPVTISLGDLIVVDPDANDPYPAAFTMTASPGANYTLSGPGNLTVTPALDFTGTLSVPVVVNDGDVNSNTFNLQILVTTENDVPVINGQTPLQTAEDVPVVIQFSHLLVTDTDNTYPDGFTIVIQSGANYTFSGTTITPALDFQGTLTVNLRVNDGLNNSAVFPFVITVTGDNDPPVITAQKTLSVVEDQPITIQFTDLTVEDPDPEDVYPTGFTMTLAPGTNYTVEGMTVQPAPNYFGTLTVPVRVNDGVNDSAPFNLVITVTPVNDAPSINPIDDQIIPENTEDHAVQITGISPGPLETQTLDVIALSSNVNLLDNAGIVFSPPYTGGSTATILLNPKPNQTGTVTVTIRVTDPGLLVATQTFTVNIENINDPPTLDPITFDPIPEDSPEQTVPLSGITAGPGESQVLTITATADNAELFAEFEVNYTSPQGTGSITFLPAANAFGSAIVSVTVTDDGSNEGPHENSITRQFTIEITPVPDPPVFVSEPVELALIGEAYEYFVEVVDVDQGAVITLEAVQIPAWLTFTDTGNGKATLAGTPPPGSSGEVMISLKATDEDDASVSQDYTLAVDARPLVGDFSITAEEDVAKVIEKLKFDAAFQDPDNDLIQTVKIEKLPGFGQLFLGTQAVNVDQEISASALPTLSYRGLLNYADKDTIVWNASDGHAYATVPAKIFVTITPVNDPPEIVNLETDVLTVNAGEGPKEISTVFEAVDVDNEFLTRAEIAFRPQNFVEGEDLLLFDNTPKITGEYNESAGILLLTGTATVAEYNAAIRTVRYDNVSEVFSTEEINKTISYTVSDGAALSVTHNREIKLVDTFEELTIPNGFTPNSDGDNDTWFITNINRHVDASVRIYTMMGQVVYTSDGFYNGWDGTYNGQLLPTDTYYYTIDLNLPFRKKVYKGAVTILR